MELSAGGIAAAASGKKDKHPNCAGAKSTADIGSRENAAKVPSSESLSNFAGSS
jgi:hypothetical protein